ncbi:hypothetical protein [Mycoplasmopsis edwardii]|nr:hypothetical protein [Mycoplasmopsis edwardii]
MFANKQLKFTETNYLKRKIFVSLLIVLLSLILFFQIIMFARFFAWTDFEYEHIKTGQLSSSWSDEEVRKNSPAYQLIYIFSVLNSVTILLSLVSIVLLSIVLINLFRNKSNGDSYLRILIWIIPIIFIILFFVIALQPQAVYKINIVSTLNEHDEEELRPRKVAPRQLSYKLIWFSMFIAFSNIFWIALAKKTFGFITKDKILAKQEHETTMLKEEIEAKLENRKPKNKTIEKEVSYIKIIYSNDNN